MNQRLFILVYLSVNTCKVIVICLISFYGLLKFEGDAEYYNDFALGLDVAASSIWPVILRDLNDIGLYSRFGISILLMLIGSILIPFQVANLAMIRQGSQKSFWMCVVLMSLYPTVFYYSMDINRDVFMLFIFLIGLFFVKLYLNSKLIFTNFFSLLGILGSAALMYSFRPYLGFGYLLAFFISYFYSFKRFSIIYLIFIGLLFLNSAFYFGFLKQIIVYRETFDNMAGGTNFGIRFDSVVDFIPKFLSSLYLQLWGVYFVNFLSVIIFILESIPFTIGIFFIIKYRQYSDKFIDFLVIFFFLYSTIWILGNDNLGTAIRLRVFSYVVVLISSFYIFQRMKFANRKRFTSDKELEG